MTKTGVPHLQPSILFVTAYGEHHRVGIDCSHDDRTKQSFKDECDINQIMARYQVTGVIDWVGKYGDPRYIDVTGADYQLAANLVAEAMSQFNDLPSSVRERFKNDPAEFLDFVQDPANGEKLREMGLRKPLPAGEKAPAVASQPPAGTTPQGTPPEPPQGGSGKPTRSAA